MTGYNDENSIRHQANMIEARFHNSLQKDIRWVRQMSLSMQGYAGGSLDSA